MRKTRAKIKNKNGEKVSISAIRNIRKKAGWKPYARGQTYASHDGDAKKRVDWCKDHVHMTPQDWEDWAFSDEGAFEITGPKNSKNDVIWAPSRAIASEAVPPRPKSCYPTKVHLFVAFTARGFFFHVRKPSYAVQGRTFTKQYFLDHQIDEVNHWFHLDYIWRRGSQSQNHSIRYLNFIQIL